MSARETDRLSRAMAALLEREADALRRGAFDRLAPLLVEKERLAERLAAAPSAARPDGPAAVRLRAAAARNDVMLQAAIDGMRRGAERIGALADVSRNLQTYDDTGRRRRLGAQRPSSERRA